jgi:regulator of replication initiation timing
MMIDMNEFRQRVAEIEAGRLESVRKMNKRVRQLMQKYDGLCLDNEEEREKLALALTQTVLTDTKEEPMQAKRSYKRKKQYKIIVTLPNARESARVEQVTGRRAQEIAADGHAVRHVFIFSRIDAVNRALKRLDNLKTEVNLSYTMEKVDLTPKPVNEVPKPVVQ